MYNLLFLHLQVHLTMLPNILSYKNNVKIYETYFRQALILSSISHQHMIHMQNMKIGYIILNNYSKEQQQKLISEPVKLN